jgi:hypothetical protein
MHRLVLLILLVSSAFAQKPTQPKSVTVPVTLDHNRIVIDVRFPLADGSVKRVRAWVDNGNPEMFITGELAKTLGLTLSGDVKDTPFGKEQTASVPLVFLVGGMPLHATGVKQCEAVLDRDSVAPGMSPEVTLPSTMLRNYDLVMDYLNRELTIGLPGQIKFQGASAKASLNPDNALLQLPANLHGHKVNLALDLGAPFGLLSSDLIADLQKSHPKWPHMTGGVGPANFWGRPEEARWDVLRVSSLQFGGIDLADIGFAALPKDWMDWFEKRAGMATAGLVGANALLNYRVGIDYSHSTVYFEQTSRHRPPEMEVIGLTLRPEPDGRYTVAGVADYDGKPSVPGVKPGDVLVSIDKTPAKGGTMGEIWSLLGGAPGEVRTLTFARDGKPFTVQATVHGFLSAEAK